MSNSPKSLAAAMRERAIWLHGKTESHMETAWGDKNSVIASLNEMADVIDSWSGEYLSKEETHKENSRRRWGTQHWSIDPQPPMTMEERIAVAKKRTTFNYGEENNGND